MRDLQILILDTAGNQLGELDLTDSDDFALKLTKSLASINDLGRRNTSFSLDFDAPQTKNNNKLLAGLRFATHSKQILGQKPCSILVDGNQVDKGFLYPYESEFEGSYKLVFKGLNNDWVEQLRDVELNELEWRDYLTGLRDIDATESFDSARITAVNQLNSTSADVIYPSMNRNNGGANADERPMLHLRSIVLSMFDKIGYTVSSAFFESDWIKGITAYTDAYGYPYEHLGLSVDPAFQMTKDPQYLIGQSVEYSTTGLQAKNSDPDTWTTADVIGNLSLPTTPNTRFFYRFPNLINTVVLDNFTRFDIATSEYTVGVGGTYSVDFTFVSEDAYYSDPLGKWVKYNFLGFGQGQRGAGYKWHIVKNNTLNNAIDGTTIYTQVDTGGQYHSNVNGGATGQYHVFATGDKISVFLELLANEATGFFGPWSFVNANSNYWKTRILNTSKLIITPKNSVTLNDVYRINTHIPDGIKCISLLQDFKTMFNLYFDVDVNRKIVFIEPRDDFYSNTIHDITDIVDLNTPPVLNYLTSYKNELVFRYNPDSKDKYLEQWNKVNDKTYAEYKYLLKNNDRFEKGQSILTTNILSPTIQGELENFVGIISSVIKEEYLDADNVGKPVNKNYAPRVFQLQRGKQYDTAGVPRRNVSPLVILVAMMEDYANTPTLDDRKLTFIGERGLVWDYYRKTLANIEDTAILTVKLNLGLYAYNSWNLRDVYYISEPAEIAGFYITDSIKNFNVTKETTTTITLVKFKDFEPTAVQGGGGNVNVITQNNPQPTPILCTVNGAIVNCLDNNFQTMYKL